MRSSKVLAPMFSSKGLILNGGARMGAHTSAAKAARAGAAHPGRGLAAGRRLKRKQLGLKTMGPGGRYRVRNPILGPPPPKATSLFARHGKQVAAAVAAGGLLYGAGNLSGRGLDKSSGRSTGMFRY